MTVIPSAERGRVVGETTITGKNQITLPAEGLRELGWDRGDRLIVTILDGDHIRLMRRPASWSEFYAGKLTGVFGDHGEVLRYLDEERRSWEPDYEADVSERSA